MITLFNSYCGLPATPVPYAGVSAAEVICILL